MPVQSVAREGPISVTGSNVDPQLSRDERRIWDFVSCTPLKSLWDLRGVPIREVASRTAKSVMEDRIFGHAAELGFYFLFALFPTLFSATSILGLIARSASRIYVRLLDYLALVIPTQALGTILSTFNETAAASSSGKITFGLIAAVWSAAVGISALQDTLNVVYKINDSRSYIRARIDAIGLTIVLTAIVSLCLASMLGGDVAASIAAHRIQDEVVRRAASVSARILGWTVATALLALAFALIYYWAPDHKTRRWHWLTPGGAIGIVGWLLASLGLRFYLHFFNSFSVTYGSLGAVIILLTWFYITGLMILLGAEVNSEIEAAAAERCIRVEPGSGAALTQGAAAGAAPVVGAAD
jgi:membrane protein